MHKFAINKQNGGGYFTTKQSTLQIYHDRWCIKMNFKRKLWWAQHKFNVYKYGTILSLVLIVTISIIYFTYSKFSSSNEVTMYETTVEPFIKNDYFIASYIDGEWSNEIPDIIC